MDASDCWVIGFFQSCNTETEFFWQYILSACCVIKISGLDVPSQWNVACMKVSIPSRYWADGGIFSISDFSCYRECTTVKLHWKLNKSSGITGKISCLLHSAKEGICCTVRCSWVCSVCLWGKKGRERSLSLSALAQRSPLAFWLSASAGATVFQKRALAMGRQVSQPASQTDSRIVCSIGLGLQPGLGQLKLPRQIC